MAIDPVLKYLHREDIYTVKSFGSAFIEHYLPWCFFLWPLELSVPLKSKLPLEKFEKFFHTFPFAFNAGSCGYI